MLSPLPVLAQLCSGGDDAVAWQPSKPNTDWGWAVESQTVSQAQRCARRIRSIIGPLSCDLRDRDSAVQSGVSSLPRSQDSSSMHLWSITVINNTTLTVEDDDDNLKNKYGHAKKPQAKKHRGDGTHHVNSRRSAGNNSRHGHKY